MVRLELILDVLELILDVLLVTLVENDADAALNDPDIFAAVKLLINTALGPRDPEIPDDVNPTAPPSSKNVTLVLKLALGATNDPVMPVFNA